MRIEQRNVYTFEELSEEAKKKAIEEYRENGMSDNEWENRNITETTEETIKEKFGNETISDLEVNWSLNSRQGDGVSFTGTINGDSKTIDVMLNNIYNNEVPKNIKRILPYILINLARGILSYYHKYTVTTNVYLEGDYTGNIDRIEKLIDSLEQEIDLYRLSVCDILENNGYDSMDFYNSDEYIISEIECNETEFLEDGSIY